MEVYKFQKLRVYRLALEYLDAVYMLTIYLNTAPLVEPVETRRWFRQAQPAPFWFFG